MRNDDKPQFIDVLMSCGEIYDREVKAGQIALFWSALGEFSLPEVRVAFSSHIKTSKFFPTPAEIIEKIPKARFSGHIGADEAWTLALKAMDENETVILNAEILQAREIALDIYRSGDKTGARMAFRDAYHRVVSGNPKPIWFVSLGQNRDSRETEVLLAYEHGLISYDKARQLLPGVELPEPETALKLAV